MRDRPSPEDSRRQLLVTAAQGIAEHLGQGWSFQSPSPGWTGWVVYLEGPGSKCLEIYQSPRHKTAEIRGQLPRLPCGDPVLLRQEDLERCRIGASLKRPPAHLARDISQRLMPGYEEVFELARRQVEEVEARDHSAGKILQELASLCRVERQTEREARNHQVTLRDGRGSIQVFGKTPSRPARASLHLSLPPEVAHQVLELATTRCPELAAQS